MRRRPLNGIQTSIVQSALSLALSDIPENWLKYAFGRTWPETWVQNNPSLIRDDVSSFNPFHGGAGFASFPSGHMVATCAILSIFWFTYPRFRWLYALLISFVFAGHLGANYHFVGDLVGGGFIGFTTGLLVLALWKAKANPPACTGIGSWPRDADHELQIGKGSQVANPADSGTAPGGVPAKDASP